MNKTITVDYDEYMSLLNEIAGHNKEIEELKNYSGKIIRIDICSRGQISYSYIGNDGEINRIVNENEELSKKVHYLEDRVGQLLSRNLWQRIINEQ